MNHLSPNLLYRKFLPTASTLRTFSLTACLWMMILFTSLRLLFFLANRGAFVGIPPYEIAWAFIHGLRFDLSYVLLVNSPFILLGVGLTLAHANPLPRKLAKALSGLFAVINFPGVAVNLVDVAYYPFTGRRSTFAVFDLARDMKAQASQLVGQYWYLLLAGLFLLPILYSIGRTAFPATEPSVAKSVRAAALSIRRRSITSICLIALVVLGIRGGTQRKPLSPTHAFLFRTTALGDLALNSGFAVAKTLDKESLPESTYFADWHDVIKAVSADYRLPLPAKDRRPGSNVVLLILESFGTEYIGAANSYRGYTPFLDSLAHRGLFFRNNYANGRRSIEAVSSLLAGIPSLMEEPYITSNYRANHLEGLPRVLRKHGYTSLFFHGGHNGTMFFDVFSNLVGFDRYIGMDEYPGPGSDYDGNWGILDEPFLKFAATELTKTSQPFFATVFTLSSHNPYKIPQQYAGKFPKGTLAIHESIGYADHSLRAFFEFAQTQPWYANTLFILTGDHTAESEVPEYQPEMGRYRVPLIFFSPSGAIPPKVSSRLTQHADVVPSVFDFLGIEPQKVAYFGRSVFDETFGGRVINQASGTYWLIHNGSTTQLNLSHEPAQRAVELTQDEQQLRAFIQYFNGGMNGNKIYQ